jgi:proteasome lid subunit RPN8/RPN11
LGELERSDGLLDCVETGGNLFGHRGLRDVELIHATGPGEDGKARRFEDSVRISMRDAQAQSHELERIYGADVVLAGGWHTHPRLVREPSETDRSQALSALDHLSALRWAPYWLDLIVVPNAERGWDMPALVGWVTRRNEWGRAVTEPARIEGRS